MFRKLIIPALVFVSLAGCYVEHDRVVPVRETVYDSAGPMPAERVEVVPDRPRTDAVWHKGHWERNGEHWVWVSGYWT